MIRGTSITSDLQLYDQSFSKLVSFWPNSAIFPQALNVSSTVASIEASLIAHVTLECFHHQVTE